MTKNKQEIKIDFGNGMVSIIDKNVHRLILELQKQILFLNRVPPAIF